MCPESYKYLVTPQNMLVDESQRKDTRKTAKRLIKLAKKHPEWYTKDDVRYAKYIRKELKKPK